MKQKSFLKIAIVGAGFSGVSLAANLYRLSQIPIEIILFDKTGHFGVGDAYRTPFSFHLLNVRAKDMSAFEDEPLHFVNWLKSKQFELTIEEPLEEQFVPRVLYRQYLSDLLAQMQGDEMRRLNLEPYAVLDAHPIGNKIEVTTTGPKKFKVDKLVLAFGNNPPNKLPFEIDQTVKCFSNPWDYLAPTQIAKQAPVLIVGTGLSMIDTVLTLYHHHHQGKIYAVSRHGLLPLAHVKDDHSIKLPGPLPKELKALTTYLRGMVRKHEESGGNWRALITGIRTEIPQYWSSMSLTDKKRFLRHLLPYWNIHRHRVHWILSDLLADLTAKQQLIILAGRVLVVEQGIAKIKLRHTHEIYSAEVNYVVNCMGPSLQMRVQDQPLIHSLIDQKIASFDPLKLGFAVATHGALKNSANKVSAQFYTLGSSRKGEVWEINAVPDLRIHSLNLARHLLANA